MYLCFKASLSYLTDLFQFDGWNVVRIHNFQMVSFEHQVAGNRIWTSDLIFLALSCLALHQNPKGSSGGGHRVIKRNRSYCVTFTCEVCCVGAGARRWEASYSVTKPAASKKRKVETVSFLATAPQEVSLKMLKRRVW